MSKKVRKKKERLEILGDFFWFFSYHCSIVYSLSLGGNV